MSVQYDLHRKKFGRCPGQGDFIFFSNVGGVLDPDNLSQLRMHWDGCAMDGTPLDEGVLIAARHPAEVRALIEQMNHLKIIR